MRKHGGLILAALLLTLPLGEGVDWFNRARSEPVSSALDPSAFSRDEKGVPWVVYKGNLGKQRNPVTIARMAVRYYELSLAGDAAARQSCLHCADFLVERAVRRRDALFLDYDFKNPGYGLEVPWRSALAQGEALPAMVRAHRISRDGKYLAAARGILAAFRVEVKDQGITYKDAPDRWWYEEIAKETGPHPRVLNGKMSALLGIHDYWEETKDPEAKELFDLGVRALAHGLPGYDDPALRLSYYDAKGFTAGEAYHRGHIRLCGEFHRITGMEVFRLYHDRWQGYADQSFTERLFRKPNGRRVRIAAGSFAALLGLAYGVVWLRSRRRVRTLNPYASEDRVPGARQAD